MSKILSSLIVSLFCASIAWGSLGYECQKCHQYAGLSSEEHPFWVGEANFEISKHRDLACTDCHKGDVSWPHDAVVETRCDLACHGKGKDHKEVVEAESGSAHLNAAVADGSKESCLFCHDGAPALKGADVQTLCVGCHPKMEKAREKFPDSPGAFGDKAHRRAAEWANVPGCIDCHGAHGIASSEDARAACFQGGCHEGGDESFAALFDHGPKGGAQKSGGGLLWLGVAVLVGLVGLLHSVKG